MLNFLPGKSENCEGISRRGFLQVGTLAGLGAAGLSLPQLLAGRQASAAQAGAAQSSSAKAQNVILVWTQGGTSHHDTFDPKPEAPASVKGEFSAIDTSIPGVKFSEICPKFAKNAHRFGLLRGWNPRNGSHGTADLYVMSGNKFNTAMPYPCYGAVVSQQFGFRNVLPPFVQLGTNVDHRFGGGSAGYLGIEHNPFEVSADPAADNFTVRDISPPRGVDMDRVSRRRQMLSVVDQLQRQADRQPAAFAALDEHTKAAMNIITSPQTKEAFDIHAEDPRLRDRYGRHKFGQSCLLARRLIESGVRFVTVTDGGWDTHANNFTSLKERKIPPVDEALPQLVADLEDRGMLDNTLVVWLTDFGRTPQINSASGRDHWATAGFALFAGAGVPGGSVVGRTDDEGGQVADGEYFSEDIAATIYHKLGIPLDLYLHAPDGRPVALNHGTLIREWT